MTLSSAVCTNIDQRALGNGTVGHKNDIPTYRILHNPTRVGSEASCCDENNPPLFMMVVDDKGVRVQIILKMYTMEYKK